MALLVLAPFRGEQIAKKIQHGLVRQVPEFAGIEKRAAANGAMFKPDVVLVQVYHSNHAAGAARAIDDINPVEITANFIIPDVQSGCVFEAG